MTSYKSKPLSNEDIIRRILQFDFDESEIDTSTGYISVTEDDEVKQAQRYLDEFALTKIVPEGVLVIDYNANIQDPENWWRPIIIEDDKGYMIPFYWCSGYSSPFNAKELRKFMEKFPDIVPALDIDTVFYFERRFLKDDVEWVQHHSRFFDHGYEMSYEEVADRLGW